MKIAEQPFTNNLRLFVMKFALDHGLASPDTADKTYRKALGKMKKELEKKDIS